MEKILFFIFLLTFSLSSITFANDSRELLKQAEEMQEKDDAIKLYQKSFISAKKEHATAIMDSVLFGLAKRYINWGMLDSAKNIGLRRIAEHEQGDSSTIIPAFYNLAAATLSYAQELDSALTYFLKAVRIFEEDNDSLKAAYIRFNIGNILFSLRDFEQADQNFMQALQVVYDYNDSTNLSGILAAIAMTKLNLGQVELSAEYSEKALQVAELRNDILGKMAAYRQMGKLTSHGSDYEAAIHFYKQALALAEEMRSVYNIAILKLELAISYNAMENYKEALRYAHESLETAPPSIFKTQLIDLYKVLSDAYMHVGNDKEALKYLNLVIELRDEQITKENNRIVNNLLVQYQTEKKDKQLIEQELLLVNAKEQNRLYSFLGLLAILIILFISWIYVIKNKLNKSKLKELEAEQEWEIMTSIITGEEQERKRLATELHDGLSNNLFTCKLSLSSIEFPDSDFQKKLQKNILLIDQIRKETRMMAHNLLPINLTEDGLQETVNQYVENISDHIENSKIFFQAFGEDQTKKLDKKAAIVLYRICQELIGNALKYAQATEIDVQFFQENNELKIIIEDNGIGFDVHKIKNGQGLGSIPERLKLINGTFDINSTLGKGTYIHIKINI